MQSSNERSLLQSLLSGQGNYRARKNANLERMIAEEAEGLMQDEQGGSNGWHPPMSNPGNKGWHPPMASSEMPNTPRDPDKEMREKQAMKAFLSGGGGPSFGMKKSPMASIHPSQNPFAEPTASAEERSQVAGKMMMSQIPKAPVQDVQGGMPKPNLPVPEEFSQPEIPTQQAFQPGRNSGQSADHGQVPDPLRDRLMEMLNAEQSPDGRMENLDRSRELDQRMSAISSQNADLGFMKLLMRNANQMGQIGGKVASSAPFDDMVGGMQERNAQAESRFINADQKAKSEKDNRLQTMLALLKMDQDGNLRREGFDIQREGFKNSSADRNAILQATIGRDGNSYELGKKRIEADIDGKNATLGIQGRSLEESMRHNKEQEKIAGKNAEVAAAKAAKNGEHLPMGMKERVLTISQKQANRTSMINKMKASLAELKRLKDPKSKFDYAKSTLKMVNSPENPDAVGSEEADRIGANLDNFRWQDALVGSNPFGKNFSAFENLIQSQINAMEGNYKSDQRELDSISKQYPAPRGVFNPGMANPSPEPSGQRRVIDNFDDL